MLSRYVCRVCFILTTTVIFTLLLTTANAQSSEDISSALQENDGGLIDLDRLWDPVNAYRQLALIQAEEDMILSRLDSLKLKLEHVKVRKRGHVQCLVNLVACYGKRS